MSGQQIATRTPMQEVCERIASDEFTAKLAQALPANVTPDRFVRVALTAIQQTPALIAAERQSLYNSVIRCAQDGLLPDGREAALVIFKTKGVEVVQYLPMISGLRKRLAEHGITLSAFAVYANDEFDYQLGDAPIVRHKPPKLGSQRGDLIGAYATAADRHGKPLGLEVMSRDEIERVRAVSRAAKSEYGPWVQWFDEMARKTVARRLYKQLPLHDTDGSLGHLIESADAEYDFPSREPQLTEREANVKAISQNLPQPPDEDTQVRNEPAADKPDEAQLNWLATLAGSYEGDVGVYLMGAFGVDSLEQLTVPQAAQAEIALARLVAAQAEQQPTVEDAGEGEYEEPAVEAQQESFADMVPESARQQDPPERKTRRRT